MSDRPYIRATSEGKFLIWIILIWSILYSMSCMHNFWYSEFSLSHWLSSTSQRLEICINHRFYTICIIMWNLVNRIERCIVIFCLLRINQTIELHEKCQSAECSPNRDLSQNESDNLCGPVYACFGEQELNFKNWLEAFRGNWRHMEQASAYNLSCKRHVLPFI